MIMKTLYATSLFLLITCLTSVKGETVDQGLQNLKSGKCLSAPLNPGPKAFVTLSECGDINSIQGFIITKGTSAAESAPITLDRAANGVALCLEFDIGNFLILNTCTGGDDQKFFFTGGLVNRLGGGCLDASNGRDVKLFAQDSCDQTNPLQIFFLVSGNIQ